MKILQIMPEYGLAGAEIMSENLCYGLKKQNHDVIIVSFFHLETPIIERLVSNGFKVLFLDKKPGFDCSVIKKLRMIFKSEKPDIVHTHRYVLPYVYLASIGYAHKIVHTVHNVASKEVGRKQQIIQYFILRSRKVTPVTISPRVKESFLVRYKLKNKQIPMIYNGIDIDRFEKKANYDLHNGGTILHIGRFSRQKNHIRLIDAFKLVKAVHPQSRLQLIGSGDLEQSIIEYVKTNELADSVEFLGLKDDVRPYLYNADVFVLSSDYEGMPITIIEAMATGLPIVSTEVGGVPDMIHDQTSGYLVSLSSDELSIALIDLLNSKKLRNQLGDNAKIDSNAFSLSTMTNNYLDVYR